MKHQNMDIIARCRGLPGEEVQGGPEKMGWAGLGGGSSEVGVARGWFLWKGRSGSGPGGSGEQGVEG